MISFGCFKKQNKKKTTTNAFSSKNRYESTKRKQDNTGKNPGRIQSMKTGEERRKMRRCLTGQRGRRTGGRKERQNNQLSQHLQLPTLKLLNPLLATDQRTTMRRRRRRRRRRCFFVCFLRWFVWGETPTEINKRKVVVTEQLRPLESCLRHRLRNSSAKKPSHQPVFLIHWPSLTHPPGKQQVKTAPYSTNEGRGRKMEEKWKKSGSKMEAKWKETTTTKKGNKYI